MTGMNRLIRLIENEIQGTEEDMEIFRYGLEILAMKIYFLIGAVIIGTCLGMAWETILFLSFFIPMRAVAGGYHCKSRFRCAVGSVVLLLIAIGLMNLVTDYVIMNQYLIGMFIISLYTLWFVAPVGTRNKPLDEPLMERCHKKVCRRILIYVIAFLLANVLKWELVESALCVATFLVAITVGWGYLANENIPSTDM